MNIFLIILYALIGGILFRIRGGAPKWEGLLIFPYGTKLGEISPRFIKTGLCAAALTLPMDWGLVPWWAALVAFGLSFVMISRGHGDFLDFGTNPQTDPDEWLNPLVRVFTNDTDGFKHDFIGMIFSGISYTIFPAIILSIWHSPLWLILLAVGALKGPAYALGHKTGGIPVSELDSPTGLAEFLTGFFLCFGTGILWWLI